MSSVSSLCLLFNNARIGTHALSLSCTPSQHQSCSCPLCPRSKVCVVCLSVCRVITALGHIDSPLPARRKSSPAEGSWGHPCHTIGQWACGACGRAHSCCRSSRWLRSRARRGRRNGRSTGGCARGWSCIWAGSAPAAGHEGCRVRAGVDGERTGHLLRWQGRDAVGLPLPQWGCDRGEARASLVTFLTFRPWPFTQERRRYHPPPRIAEGERGGVDRQPGARARRGGSGSN